MGYLTDYNLTVIMPKGATYESDYIIYKLRKEFESARYALSESGECNDSTKWYDHKVEMEMFSREHPDVLFILSGVGEEAFSEDDTLDVWKLYVKNGVSERIVAQVAWPEPPSFAKG